MSGPTRNIGERVAVAMSGGVDSSVAALLAKRAGHDVVGFFLRNGVVAGGPGASRSCCSVSDAADARQVAAQLDIPFYAIDVADRFDAIVDGFVDEYRRGRTPNPCVRCNVEVKFGRLLDLARSIGAARVATGHYARVATIDGRHVLLRGRDLAKDQSYVLAGLSQEQLRAAMFPLGELEKREVRALAAEAGLVTADKAESQEICFVTTGDYRDLLRERAPETNEPGELVTTTGEVVGRHDGIAHFTVGQRKGIGAAPGAPRHVVGIEPGARRVIVGSRQEASSRVFDVEDVNWVLEPEPPVGERRSVTARIRHRQAGSPAEATVTGAGRVRARFAAPEFAIAPGQTAVLYVGDAVLAAGTIAASEPIPNLENEG